MVDIPLQTGMSFCQEIRQPKQNGYGLYDND